MKTTAPAFVVAPGQADWLSHLRCPQCSATKFETILISPWGTDPLPAHGNLICAQCHAVYPIRDHILEMQPNASARMFTFAGWTNQMPLAPQFYERAWRAHAMTFFTGEAFPREREMAFVNEWLPLRPHALVLDLGTSTGWYARGLANATRAWGNASPTFVAVDMARNMLHAARGYAFAEDLHRITYLQAPVEALPFADESVDALVCGASLNEFRSVTLALREAQRVAKTGGTLFTMSLLAATQPRGKWIQAGVNLTGISFPTLDAFNTMVHDAGWQIEKQKVIGIVTFNLMRKI